MTITRGTFCGASLRSFSSSAGWGGSPAQISIQLVEDTRNSDLFVAPTVGGPISFTFHGFKFQGLVQNWTRKYGTDGYPVYEVVAVDPREILEGTTVIIGGYGGSVGTCPSLLNVYAYHEAQGYGNSQINESGMPFSKVKQGIEALTSLPTAGLYGGPLRKGNYSYRLDLSQIPLTPTYYRIGGLSISLLDLISQVCEDSGHDYYFILDAYTIRVRTVSRVTQPPLGKLSILTQQVINQQIVTRSQYGIEARNEPTSSFLVGGEINVLYQASGLLPFFGYDSNGSTISSATGSLDFRNTAGNIIKTVNTSFAQLNSSPIADILGKLTYECSTLEMRCAQANYETWAAFINTIRPDIANTIDLSNIFRNNGANAQLPLRADVVDDGRANANRLALAALQRDTHARVMRVYEFVKAHADEYYGKKYLAILPTIQKRRDAESGRVSTSYEISQEGGYLVEGQTPLGLSDNNLDLLTNPDGRYRPFVRFDTLSGVDLSLVSPQQSVIDNNKLYLEMRVDPNLVYLPDPVSTELPACVITLPAPVKDRVVDAVGDQEIAAAILQLTPERAQRVLRQAHVGVKIAPSAHDPDYVAVPLKSTTVMYGPWYVAGAPGKVKYEQDPSLVPWNYGGFNLMNTAANARVTQSLTNTQQTETGQIELAEPPRASLGEVMIANGPILTGIDVQISTQGVTTTYRFHTYSPRFGVFGKSYENRLRKYGQVQQGLQRALRQALRENQAKQDDFKKAEKTKWLQNLPNAFRRESPHDTLISYSAWNSGDNEVRLSMSTSTLEESITLANGDSGELFRCTSVMSLDGLIRPFSTNPDSSGYMPKYVEPSGFVSGALTKDDLDPFGGANDIPVWAWGDEYAGLNAYARGGDYTNARPACLRGPMILAGWGYDIFGNPTPSGEPGEFVDNYRKRQDLWKAAPVDLKFDPVRAVWTSPGVMRGKLSSPLGAGSTEHALLYTPTGLSTLRVRAKNFSTTTAIASGTDVMLMWSNMENVWFVGAAECS